MGTKVFRSSFKNEVVDHRWFESWITRLEVINGRKYGRLSLNTSLGKTHVWCLNNQPDAREALLFHPWHQGPGRGPRTGR